jgi:K+/H+ antiporter YhaU regulatory subunit KhtT
MVAQIMVETQVRTILGRRKLGKGGEMILNPSSETLIKAGNTLIALGPAKDLDRLSKILLH